MRSTVHKNVEQTFVVRKAEASLTIARVVAAIAASIFVLLSAQLANAVEDHQPRLLREARELASSTGERCNFTCSVYSDNTTDLETCFKMQNRCELGSRKTSRKHSKKIVSSQ